MPERHGFNPWVRKIPWRTAQKPTPVSLPGQSHGQRSLVGYSPWGRKESDTTERLSNNNTAIQGNVATLPPARVPGFPPVWPWKGRCVSLVPCILEVATSQRCSEDRGNWLCPMSRVWVLPTPWTLHLVVREPHFIEPSRRSGSANLLLHS